MNSIERCPFCKSEKTSLLQLDRREWVVVCDDCGATGPIAYIPVKAREAWGMAVLPSTTSSLTQRLFGK
jgi:uncharacterized Zn finger protein